MTIQMVLALKKEQLSTYRTNIIQPVLSKGDGSCGEVTKIINERGDGFFDCEVKIYPAYEDKVLKALQVHTDKMSGR